MFKHRDSIIRIFAVLFALCFLAGMLVLINQSVRDDFTLRQADQIVSPTPTVNYVAVTATVLKIEKWLILGQTAEALTPTLSSDQAEATRNSAIARWTQEAMSTATAFQELVNEGVQGTQEAIQGTRTPTPSQADIDASIVARLQTITAEAVTPVAGS